MVPECRARKLSKGGNSLKDFLKEILTVLTWPGVKNLKDPKRQSKCMEIAKKALCRTAILGFCGPDLFKTSPKPCVCKHFHDFTKL